MRETKFVASVFWLTVLCGALVADTATGVTWDLVTYYPATHYNATSMKEFSTAVEKKTNGQVTVRVRAAGELPVTAAEVARAVGEGRAPLGDAYAEFVAGDVPISLLPTLPLLAPTRQQFERIMPVVEPLIERRLEQLGAEMLFWYIAGAKFEIFGRGKRPRSLEDFKGMKIRALGPTTAEFVRRLGATPVTIAAPEVSTAVQRGVMDAFIASAPFSVSFKWHEFVDWGWDVDIQLGGPSMIVVNREAFSKLPTQVREAVRQAGRELAPSFSERTLELDKPARETLTKRGVVIVKPSAEEERRIRSLMEPLWEDWAKGKGPEFVRALTEIRKVLGH